MSSKRPSSSSESEQLWKALHNADCYALEKVLFEPDESADDGLRLAPHAKNLVNALEPKKKLLPLVCAVENQMEEQGLRHLLRAGAAINATDGTKDKRSALHSAVWSENDAAVHVLLECGADPRVVDAEGGTPLHIAASVHASNVAAFLLEEFEKRASSKDGVVELLGIQDNGGNTALHLSVCEAGHGSSGVAEVLLDSMEQQIKTARGTADEESVRQRIAAIVNKRTTTGATPLHYLVSGADGTGTVVATIARRLVALGGDVLTRDEDGHCVLRACIDSLIDAKDTMAALLEEGLKAKTEEEIRAAFLHRDEENGYALVHAAIAARNTSALEAMAKFLSLHGKGDLKLARELLREVESANGVTVESMILTRKRIDVLRVLHTVGLFTAEEVGVASANVERAKAEERAEAEQRKQAMAAAAAAQADDGSDVSEGDEGSGAAKKRGDYTGFGSGTLLGTRQQQARKAKAMSGRQRKAPIPRPDSTSGAAETGPVVAEERVSLSMIVIVVVVLLSIGISAYSFIEKWKISKPLHP